jgi:hypothetical protein
VNDARHSKATPRWGTPSDIVERARRCMGGIDLDPSSESKFNATVQATRYYSLLERGEDGLKLPWFGRVFCNPPGGLVVAFWECLLGSGIEQAIWVGFSVEQLCILADAAAHPADFSLCYVRKRIPFKHHAATPTTKDRPSHANYIVGVSVAHEAFESEFGPIGKVTRGPMSFSGRYA